MPPIKSCRKQETTDMKILRKIIGKTLRERSGNIRTCDVENKYDVNQKKTVESI